MKDGPGLEHYAKRANTQAGQLWLVTRKTYDLWVEFDNMSIRDIKRSLVDIYETTKEH